MAKPAQVALQIQTHLELAGAHPGRRHAPVVCRQLGIAERHVQTAGIGPHARLAGAQQPPQRLPGQLALQVPQRHVQAAHGSAGNPHRTGLEQGVVHALPQPAHGARIGADQQLGETVDGGARVRRRQADAGSIRVAVYGNDETGVPAPPLRKVGIADGAVQTDAKRTRGNCADFHDDVPRRTAASLPAEADSRYTGHSNRVSMVTP